MKKSIIGLGVGLGLAALVASNYTSPPRVIDYNGHPYAVTQQINGGNRQVVLERIHPGINPNTPPPQSVPRYLAFVIENDTVKQVIYRFDGELETRFNVSFPISTDSMLVRAIENSQR